MASARSHATGSTGKLVEGGPARVFLVDGQTIELFEPNTDPPSLLPGI
ncbi:MAG: hypothetical protein ACXWM8_07865 [Candidatus Limnocylindrales bacterium]